MYNISMDKRSNTRNNIIFTVIIGIMFLLMLFTLIHDKPSKFQNNHDIINEKYFKIYDKPCLNKEGVEVICKG